MWQSNFKTYNCNLAKIKKCLIFINKNKWPQNIKICQYPLLRLSSKTKQKNNRKSQNEVIL